MEFTPQQIARAQSPEGDIWTFGNAVPYRMCEENSAQDDPQVVVAKTWLIGRSYAAAVERGGRGTSPGR